MSRSDDELSETNVGTLIATEWVESGGSSSGLCVLGLHPWDRPAGSSLRSANFFAFKGFIRARGVSAGLVPAGISPKQ